MDGFGNWLGEGVHLIPQRGEDLGDRQLNAFIDSAKLGFSKSVVIGTDCPSITTSDICTAFNSVDQGTIALGPACDGGYYLIGSTIPRAELFEKVNWGTGTVFGEVSFNAERIGTDVVKLPGRYDIDRYDDLVGYYQSGRYSVDEKRQHQMRVFLESLFGGNSHDR